MVSRRAYYKITAILVCVSFLYAPLSDVVPGWFGMDLGHHSHSDGIWHGQDDHHKALFNSISYNENGYDKGPQTPVAIEYDDAAYTYDSQNDRTLPDGHGHHVHMVDALCFSSLLKLPSLITGPTKLVGARQPRYRLSPPLLKPPKFSA